MIIDTSNALAAPGSSRGYACLSVACRSIAPGGASGLLGVRGWGSPRRAPPGPSVPPSADPATSALPFRRARTFPLPPRSLRGHASGGGGEGGPAGRTEKEGRRRRPRRGRGKREPARAELPRPRPSPPRPGFLPSGGSLAPHAARGAGFVGPGRVEGPVPPPSRVVGGGGVCRRGGGGEARSEGLRGEKRGRGSASRSPRFAARPWWRPGVRPTAAPAPHLPAAVPRHHRPVLPARSARQGPEARPAARPAALAAAFPGFACPRR